MAVYVVGTVAIWGATPGMKSVGLLLVTSDGGEPGLVRVMVRHICSMASGWIFLLGYLCYFIDSDCRTWHDIVSGTRVVRERQVVASGEAARSSHA